MRGKKWVLLPHVVEVADKAAAVNLFEVPGGYVIPGHVRRQGRLGAG